MAITYLDENVKQKNSALYGGIYYSMGAVGPAIGYLLGSAFVKVFTNIGEKVDITPDQSSWVGAWWPGFLFIGIIGIVVSVFICMFPTRLPGTERYRINRNSELHRNRRSLKACRDEDFGKSWKDAPKVIFLLIRNLPFVLLTLSVSMDFAFIYGFNTFGAKYIESVFGVDSSSSALYFGVAAIFAAAGGQFTGGYVLTKFKLKVTGIMKFMIIFTVFGLGTMAGFVMTCENQGFAGATVPYHGEASMNLNASCNQACRCITDVYAPVCGEDGLTYFSPCFAGCEMKINDTNYSNCSCILPVQNNSYIPGVAKNEMCASDGCGLLIPFILVIFFAFFFTLIKTTPNLQATLRCIPFNLRTPAISLQRLFCTLLGTIPGRIVCGKVLDMACVSWATECGEGGACKAYNRTHASKYMTILMVLEMVACLLLRVLALFVYKSPNEGSFDVIETENTDIGQFDEGRVDEDSDVFVISTEPGPNKKVHLPL